MAKINPLPADQKESAYLMRQFRLKLGMSMPSFGKLVGLDSNNLNAREFSRTPWKKSELQLALPAIVEHLNSCLKDAETLSIAVKLSLTTDEKP